MIVGPKSFASIGHVTVKVHINLVVSGCDDAVFIVNTSAKLIDHLRSISIGRNLRTENVQFKLSDFNAPCLLTYLQAIWATVRGCLKVEIFEVDDNQLAILDLYSP